MRKILFLLFFAACKFIFAQAKLTLENIWLKPKYNSKMEFNMVPMKNPELYSKQEDSDTVQCIVSCEFKNGQNKDTLFNNQKVLFKGKAISFTGYSLSDDESKILLTTNLKSVYRHSFQADYFIYDRNSKRLIPLDEQRKQMYADFSPDGNYIAYVSNRNLYVFDILGEKTIQVTNDGEDRKIINGAVDWVYEEEFSMNKGFFWNNNGSKIVYYRFNESNVPEFGFDEFNSQLYPQNYKYKYPKAGEPNSLVEVFCFDIASQLKTKIKSTTSENHYTPRIGWTKNNSKGYYFSMNRLQNDFRFYLFDAEKGDTTLLFSEKNETYIDVDFNPNFTMDGEGFFFLSERSGFNHIYFFDYKTQKSNAITTGNFEVFQIKSIDEKLRQIIYLSNEGNELQKHIYSISFDGKKKIKLNNMDGYCDVMLNSNNSLGVFTCSNANTPLLQEIREINKNISLRILHDNKALKDSLNAIGLAKKEFVKFKISENEYLNGFILKPIDFNPEKKYPVIVHIYGGPGSNTVLDRWGGNDFMWQQFMVKNGFIIVSADNRGTLFRGKKFKDTTYKQLGKLECEDQLAVAKFLRSQTYVDTALIGIQGWSFGGYLSSLCLAKGNGIYTSAIAVAPVTNWKYYDNIYTERFLQTPQLNEKGYEENSPINFVKNIKGKYFLIHGTADDNVHFQNTVEMVRALQKAAIPFDLMIYPDKNHGISGGNTRYDVYKRISQWWFNQKK